jgi:hypothetical protein
MRMIILLSAAVFAVLPTVAMAGDPPSGTPRVAGSNCVAQSLVPYITNHPDENGLGTLFSGYIAAGNNQGANLQNQLSGVYGDFSGTCPVPGHVPD